MRKVVIVLTVTMALVTSLQLLASTAVAEPTLYFCDVPNKDIVITNDVEKTWLFIGNIYYQSGHCTNIQTTLYVDGSPVGNWAQGGCYDNSGTIEAVHCQTLSAGTHTVRFSYTVKEGGVNSARFVGFPVPLLLNKPPNTPDLQYPDHNVWLNYNPTYGARVTDSDGDNVRAYFQVSGWKAGWSNWVSSGGTSTWSEGTLPDGTYSWRAYAQDSKGANSGWSGYWTVKKDTVKPTASIDQENGISRDIYIWVKLTESDERSGVKEGDVDVRIDGDSWTHYSSTISDFIYTGSDGHTYEFRYRVQDNAGNWSPFSYDGSVTIEIQRETTLVYDGDLSGQYSDTVTLSATLTDKTSGGGVSGKLITFTIDSQQVADAITDANGKATKTITLTQIPGNYTVVAEFAGDDLYLPSTSPPKQFTILKEDTVLTYMGDTSGQHSDAVTVKAKLTDQDSGQGIANRTISFSIGTQSATAITDSNGVATTSIILAQNPANDYTVETDFAGDGYYHSSHDSDPFDIQKEDTVLVYNGDLSEQYSDTAKVSATLTDADSGLVIGDPHPGCEGETITFTIGTQSTSAISDATGYAEGAITLMQAPDTYTVETDFAGTDYYLPAHDSDSFTVEKEDTVLTYNGDLSGQYSDSIILKSTLAEMDTEVGNLSGKTIVFTIGSQTATATTNAAGVAQTTMALNQSAGSYTVETAFAGDAYYLPSNDSDTFEILKEDTILTYTGPTSGQYSDEVTLSATLAETDGEVGNLSGKTITFTIGTQSVTATTDASGVATKTLILNQAAGNYQVKAEFAGDSYYKKSEDSKPFDILHEDTILTYTGSASGQYSDEVTLSAKLEEQDTQVGDLSGKKITFTIGTQSATATTDASGVAITTLILNQAAGNYQVKAEFAGDGYYKPSKDDSKTFEILKEDTILTYTGDLSGQYSDEVTLSATLAETDSEVGNLSGKTITFTIGTQSTTATTDASGVATASITLAKNPVNTYTVEADFPGDGYYLPSHDSDPFDIQKEDTVLVYNGDLSEQYSDTAKVSATLTDADSGLVIGDPHPGCEGETITFTIGTQSTSAISDATGYAEGAITLMQAPDTYTVETDFAGTDYYLPAHDSDSFTIEKEDTVLSVPNGAIVYSDETTIQVTLYDDDGQTLFHQSDYPKVVYLEYFDGTNWTVISQDTLDSPGDSFFDVFFEIEIPANLDEIAGIYDIRARFDGDIYYNGEISGTGTLTISKEDTVLSPPNGTVTYGKELVITVTLLDNDGETLLHQADTPKTVYLEFFDGSNWLLLAEDSLNSADNSDYELDLAFVCDGPVPPFDDGDYLIRVRFDGDNRYNGDITEGTLIILNAPPEANAGDDQTVDEGDSVTFDGSGSFDIDTNPTDEIPYLAYDWDFADGSGGTGVNQTHAYGDNGVYTVTLTVTDDDGAQDSDTMVVTVNNVAPSVSIDSVDQPNPHFILPHHKLTFTGSFTDPGWLDNHTDIWDFGDSTTAPGTLTEENEPPDATGTSTVKHAYSEPGTYTVTLTITDDDNGVGTSEPWTVTVLGAGQAVGVLDDYIQSLPDSAFKKPAKQRKNALHNKLMEVVQLIAAGEYQEAIDKLQHDIRAKADGSVDGNPKNDWITDPAAQQEICAMIDDIIAYLQTLSAPALAPALAEFPEINGKGKGKGTEAALSLSPSYTFGAPSPYPQPCNPEVWIPYTLGKGVEVTIGIYSANGKLVCVLDIGYQKAGVYISREKAAHWDGRNEYGERVSSGIYFYTIKAGNFIATKKLVVLR